MAMRAGKDVYSEKPSSMTIAEGQAVVATARRYGRVYQTGTQRLSEDNFTFANELLRTGRLGQVHTVRAHIAPWDAAEMKYDWLPAEPEPPKDEVDWDQWLGPCPWRPYNSAYTRGGWRGYYDFHTSCIGEWGAHTFAQCQVAIGAANTSAIEYGYVNNPTGDGMVTVFPNGVKMILSRGDQWWHGSCGVRYEGTEGWVAVADGYAKPEVSSPALLADFSKLVKDYMARTERPMSHVRESLRLHQVPPPHRRQPRSHAPLHVHRPRRQHLHVAQARHEIRPRQRGIRQRPGGQPPPLPRHAGPVDHLTCSKPPTIHPMRPIRPISQLVAALLFACATASFAEPPSPRPRSRSRSWSPSSNPTPPKKRKPTPAANWPASAPKTPSPRWPRSCPTRSSPTWPAMGWRRSPIPLWTRPCARRRANSRAGCWSASSAASACAATPKPSRLLAKLAPRLR